MTKNWQERFEEEFWGKFGSTKTINEIKQFISQAIDQTREETIREITKSNTDYLTKLCWSDKDIEYFLRQYKSLINK